MNSVVRMGIGGLGLLSFLLGPGIKPCSAQLLTFPSAPLFFPQVGPFIGPVGQSPFFGPIGQTPFFSPLGQNPFFPLGQNSLNRQTSAGQSSASGQTSSRTTFRQFGRGGQQQTGLVIRPLPNLAANNSNLVGNALSASLFAASLNTLNASLSLGNPWLGNTLFLGNPWLGNPLVLGNPWLGNTLFLGNPWLGNPLTLGIPWLNSPLGLTTPGLGIWGTGSLWGTPASLWGNPFLTTLPNISLWGNGLLGSGWGTSLTPRGSLGLNPWGAPLGGLWGLPGINPFANPFLTSPLGVQPIGGVVVGS